MGSIIDTDLHNVVPNVKALFPFLSDHWREYVTQSAFQGPVDTSYPKGYPTTARPGTNPPEGGPPGSSLGTLRKQALDAWNAEFGILNCGYAIESIHNPDSAAAIASGVNDWQIHEWLEKEPRLRASIVVPSQQPEMAAKEIDRVGQHPGFVQVYLPVHSSIPYGNRHFHPIFEAAVRHDLVVGMHFGGSPGNPSTSSGWPSYYIEDHVNQAQMFQSQLLSVIVEGVFDRFPSLRMALIEAGFTWLPSFFWRMDKEWKGLRREIPWTRQLPSEYIKQHVRMSIQPVDPPADLHQLRDVIDQIDCEELLMFSTDYPHWHFDTPTEAFPITLPDPQMRKIMSENARSFYKLSGAA